MLCSCLCSLGNSLSGMTMYSLESVTPCPSAFLQRSWSTCASLAAANKPWWSPPGWHWEHSRSFSVVELDAGRTCGDCVLHRISDSWRHEGKTGGVRGVWSSLAGWRGSEEGSWNVAEGSKGREGCSAEAGYSLAGWCISRVVRAVPLPAGSLLYSV